MKVNSGIIKKTSIGILSFLTLVLLLLAFIYFYAAEKVVSSEAFSNFIVKITKQTLNADFEIKNPKLKTYFSPKIDFKIDYLLLSKDSKTIIYLKDFDSSFSFNKIFKKELKVNKLLAQSLVVKVDELLKILPKSSENQNNNDFDYKLDIYSANIALDNFEVSYIQKNKTKLDLSAKKIKLNYRENYKNIEFFLKAIISKNNIPYATILSYAIDEIKIYNNKIEVSDLKTKINESKLKLSSHIDSNKIYFNVKTKNFYLKDIFALINSDFAVENGSTMLKPLNCPQGSVAFDISYLNGALDGVVDVKNTGAKIKDVSNIPLKISEGKILVSKDKIKFNNLVGYWGKNKKNKISVYGDIKDYYKTFDSNITIDTVINNEFFKDYLAKLINGTNLYISSDAGTRIIYKAKNNIMDITWLAKIAKGTSFGVEGTEYQLTNYDRAVKGDFNIDGNLLDIKNINYYIASEIKKGVKIEPIIVLDAKMDLAGNVSQAGFAFGREMPCEFLNLFVKQKPFKKGTIKGNIHVVFKEKTPVLDADMQIKSTFLPQYRLFIKDAALKTKNGLISVDAEGRFKRVKYIFKGSIKNELKAPFTIKDLDLDIDNVNVERLLASLNHSPDAVGNTQPAPSDEDDIKEDDEYMFDTNLIRILDSDFVLRNGKYKDLTFGNIKAKMTLDEKGILKINSNRFDIAQGHSSLKVNCDLKNFKYHIWLGAKDVDSNLIAKVLFNLDKEITGKASGLIELYSDKSLKLNGNIKFLINEGTIGKIGLVEYLLKVASVFRNPLVMMSPGTIMDIVSIPEGKFDKIEGELKIANNVVKNIFIQSYSNTLSALIRGSFDMERHDASLRIYTRFSSDKKTMFGFLRNLSLNSLANKVKMNTRNDANYYESELRFLPQINAPENKTQVFLTLVEGDVEHNNFLSSLKKIK